MRGHDTLPNEFNPRFLEHLDGRTIVAREMRRRVEAVHDDLGGEEGLSYAQKSLVRRAIWLESWLETQEINAAEGGSIDIGRQTQALNALLGLWRTLGLERRARDVSLAEYLQEREAKS